MIFSTMIISQSSFSSVYIGGRHMGGNSDMQVLAANGQLQVMLNELMAARSDELRSSFLRGEIKQAML
jgi:hypothetical protein